MGESGRISVLLLTRYDRMGASSRLRFLDYVPDLSSHGFDTTIAPFFDDEYLKDLYAKRRTPRGRLTGYYRKRLQALRSAARYDLVWIEKEALPWLPHWIETRYLKKTPYVVDFDDAWYTRYENHREPVVRYLLQNKFPKLVGRAAATIAGNKHLEGWAKAHGAAVTVRIPTTVDLPRYTARTDAASSTFAIGWIGSPSSAIYLQAVAPALAEVTAGHESRVVLVGSGAIDLPGVAPEIVPWRESEETERLRGFDVGIMPLASDRWTEGKCAYKLIQYMAAGLPVVASPIGMNREVVTEGETGFLASSHDEWVDALEILRRDPALRRQMGAAGRRRVEALYTLQGNAPKLAEALRNAACRR